MPKESSLDVLNELAISLFVRPLPRRLNGCRFERSYYQTIPRNQITNVSERSHHKNFEGRTYFLACSLNCQSDGVAKRLS